ncbi:YlxR family protein [bacterium]|nr:YlxR family protein [bacterium]
MSCWQIKDRNDLIKITVDSTNGNIVVNPKSDIFGRSAYLCYNETCIESAFKKDKLAKRLKNSVQNELKGQLLDELRNS